MEKWRHETIDALRAGKKTSCEGCAALQYGIWERNPKVTFFAVGPNFAGGTKCNANCFYCNQNEIIREKSNQVLSNYDVHRIGASIYEDIQEICLADGEPSILPDIDKLFELIDKKGWAVWYNTNGIVYSQKNADILAKNTGSFVACALDSGTRETYKKIKRVDKFDIVVNNMKKYTESGCRVFLKYILIPTVNDNLNDINRFINIVKEVKAEHVTLSQNMSGFVDGVKHADDPDMPESMFMYFTYMVARLKEEGIDWDFQIEFISAHDIQRIEGLR